MYCTGGGSAADILQNGLRSKCLGFHSLPQSLCVLCTSIYPECMHIRTEGSYLGLAAYIYANVYMLQMLKETLPARTADADDLYCKEQATKINSISEEANIPCGTVGKETESKDDEQPSKPDWRREETLWNMQ